MAKVIFTDTQEVLARGSKQAMENVYYELVSARKQSTGSYNPEAYTVKD